MNKNKKTKIKPAKSPHDPGEQELSNTGSRALRVEVTRINFYERNPRRSKNPEYDRIKASILVSGMDQALLITVRPGDNPNNYSADYYLLEGALTTAGITGKLGYELLEGNSVQAFQTPLGTLHAFQGWADKFLATPSDGIEDLYFSFATKIRGTNVSLIYHRFNPEAGGPDYGSEWDLMRK